VLASEVTEELVEGLRDISDARGKLIILPRPLPLERWEMSIRTSGDWTYYEYTSPFKADYIPGSLLLMLDDIEGRPSQGAKTRSSPSFNIRAGWASLKF